MLDINQTRNEADIVTDADQDYAAPVMDPRSPVDVKKLIDAIEEDLRWSADFVRRIEGADETLEAFWEGQHDSGRKVASQDDPDPSPFNGASDQRIRLAEEIVAEKVLLQKAAMVNGASTFTPVEAADAPDAQLMQTLVGYFMNGPMKSELRDEIDFALHWKEAYGLSILGVAWHEELAVEPRKLTVMDLVSAATEAGMVSAGLPPEQAANVDPAVVEDAITMVENEAKEDVLSMILEPDREEELIEALQAFDPDITDAEAKRVVAELREASEATYYAPYVKESRPKWRAYMPMVDILFPPNTTHLQSAQRIEIIHRLAADQVRERAVRKSWPEGALKAVLANPGRRLTLGDYGHGTQSWVLSTAGVRRGIEDGAGGALTDEQFEIIEVLHRCSTPSGVPAIYATVLHASFTDAPLEHELQPYKHGKFPLVALRRERKKRALTDARGIPELVMTNQWAIKAQHDARTDRTSLANSPPLITQGVRSGGRVTIGPNSQISERRVGTLRFMPMPQVDLDSIGIVKDERLMINQFFGRFAEGVPQPVVQLHNQGLVNDFLLDVSEAVIMTTQLVQQYVSEERATRIVGMRFTPDQARAAIQAQWDTTIAFDVRDFHLEWLKQKAEMVSTFVLAADTLGVVDRGAYVQYLFRAIDPVMAQHLVRPVEEAMRTEIADEERALAVIFSGSEPELVPGGNSQARLDFMQADLTKSKARQEILRINGEVRAVWQNRAKFHQTQLAQQANKQIGRVGGKPVLAAAMADAGTLPNPMEDAA
jgi:hypothetical protein